MTTGEPWKKILAFTLPMLLGNVAQQLYNTVDSIVESYAIEWIDYCNSVNDDDHQLGDGCMVYFYKELNVSALSLEYI